MKQLLTLMMMLALAADAWAWKPLFVGHRGCNIGVENTAEAYRNGVDVSWRRDLHGTHLHGR